MSRAELPLTLDQDMWIYLSEREKFIDFGNEDALVWHESKIPYAVWGLAGTRTRTLKYYPTEVNFTDFCYK